jgi:hypothetical protein
MGFNLGNISIGKWTSPGVLGNPAFHHIPVLKGRISLRSLCF